MMDDSSSAASSTLSAKELRALKKNPKRYLEYLSEQNKFKSAQLAARQNELSKAALQNVDPVEQWKRERENAWIQIAEPPKPLFSHAAPVQTSAPSTSPENSRQPSPVRRGRRGLGQGAALVQERRGDEMKQSLFPDHPDFSRDNNSAAASSSSSASIGSSHVRSSSIGAGEMDRHIRIRHTRTRSHSVTPANPNDDDDDEEDVDDEETQPSQHHATQNGTNGAPSHSSITTPRVRKSWIAPTTAQLEEMRALMEEQARLHALEEGIQQREKERMRFHPPPAAATINKEGEALREESKENLSQLPPSVSQSTTTTTTSTPTTIEDSIRTDVYNEPPVAAGVAPLLSRPLSLFNSDRIASTLAESNPDSSQAVVADAGKFSAPPSLPPQDFSAPPLTFRSPQRLDATSAAAGGGAESEVETEVEEEEEMVRDRSFGRGQAQRQQKRKKWNKATPISIAASDGDRVVLSPEAPNSAKSPLLASRGGGSRDDSQLSPLEAERLEAERMEIDRVAEQARVEHVRRVLDFEHARNAASSSSSSQQQFQQSSPPTPSPPISPAPSPPTTARGTASAAAGAPPARLPPAPPSLPPSLPSTPRLPEPPESPPPESPRGAPPPLPVSARGGAETPRSAAAAGGSSPPSRAPPSRPPPSTPRVSAAVPHPPSHRPPPPPSRPPPSPAAAAAASASSSSSPPARAPPARPPPSKPSSFSPSGAQTSRVPAGSNNPTLVWHTDATKNQYVSDLDDEEDAPREDWSDPLAGGERKRDLEEVSVSNNGNGSDDRVAPRYKLIFVDGDFGRYSSFYTSKKEREMARMAMERDMAQAREAAQAQGGSKSGISSSSLIQPHTSRVHNDRLKKWERPTWATGLAVRGVESTTLETIPSAPGTPRAPDLPPTLPPTPRTYREDPSETGDAGDFDDPDLPPLPAQDGFETPRNAGNATQRYRPTAPAQPQQQQAARNEPQATDANNKDNCIIA